MLSYKDDALHQIIAYQVSANPINYPSEVHYFGGQVFLALRGDDKIMIFDEKEDKLDVNCSFKVKEYPRHFAITNESNLFVACQKGNAVQRFLVSPQRIVLLGEAEILTPSVITLL